MKKIVLFKSYNFYKTQNSKFWLLVLLCIDIGLLRVLKTGHPKKETRVICWTTIYKKAVNMPRQPSYSPAAIITLSRALFFSPSYFVTFSTFQRAIISFRKRTCFWPARINFYWAIFFFPISFFYSKSAHLLKEHWLTSDNQHVSCQPGSPAVGCPPSHPSTVTSYNCNDPGLVLSSWRCWL